MVPDCDMNHGRIGVHAHSVAPGDKLVHVDGKVCKVVLVYNMNPGCIVEVACSVALDDKLAQVCGWVCMPVPVCNVD